MIMNSTNERLKHQVAAMNLHSDWQDHQCEAAQQWSMFFLGSGFMIGAPDCLSDPPGRELPARMQEVIDRRGDWWTSELFQQVSNDSQELNLSN